MTKSETEEMVQSFPRRHATTRRFTLGAPRSFVVSRDGSSVLFLRSVGPEDPKNALWILRAGEEPRMLFDPTNSGHGELTEAEKARRERAREQASGVVSFVATPDHEAVFLALSGDLYRVSVDGTASMLESNGAVFDPRPEPNGERVAYVAGSTLRITDGTTDTSVPGTDEAPELVSWGSAEFVAAEEMGRGRGFWWAPSGDYLVAARVDTSVVDEWWISSPEQPAKPPRAIRYPAAGTNNADVQLWLVDLDSGPSLELDWAGNEFEYLADVQCLSVGGDEVVRCMVQTRDQKTFAIIDFDPTTGAGVEIDRINDEHWVELQRGTPRQSSVGLVTVVDDERRRLRVDSELLPDIEQQVVAFVGVDDGHLVATLTTDGTDSVLARISLEGEVEMLTEPGTYSTAQLGGSTLVITTAAHDRDTIYEVRWADGNRARIESHAAVPGFDCTPAFNIIGSRQLNVTLNLPAGHDGSPLPVLLDPYGGPHAQRVLRVRNAFGTSQWFAEQGFAVLVIDGRGTPGRGPAFEREVWGDLASFALEDQIDGLQALAETRDELDLSRVGIRGWSFGGYLAALAVMRRPDAIHAAVAGAPVTDWLLYDTHYTERYLGHPDAYPDHYARSSLVEDAALLTRPLMLIHGLADDNVVAAHTLTLSQALLEAGRPHEVLPLSGVTHMTPQEQVAENLLHLQRDFFQTNLG